MKSVPDQLLSKFSPHAMLDYLFQHFYSTLAIVAFFIAILILRACGKRGRRWIPVSTAPFGCMAFLVVFLLLTAFIIWLFSFFTTGPMVEDLAFTLAWLAAMACALAVISRLTEYCLAAGQIRQQALSGGIPEVASRPAPEQRHPAVRADRRHQLRY